MKRRFSVGKEEATQRLDVFLARHLPELSRSQLEKLIRAQQVLVDGRAAKPGHRVSPGEQLVVMTAPAVPTELTPEAIPLDIRYEDRDLLVINKPQGLAVHPGAGRAQGTLVNALLAHCGTLTTLGREELRPGIVHRLDRDTSGLLVAAKTDAAYLALQAQIKRRQMERRYLALAWGTPDQDEFDVNLPIIRHTTERKRMAVAAEGRLQPGARAANTHIRVRERFRLISLLEAKLGTGRTHQIRVHLAHISYPVVGDPVYGLRQARRLMRNASAELLALIAQLPGQALHAYRLSFDHPTTDERLCFEAEMPMPMATLLEHLRASIQS